MQNNPHDERRQSVRIKKNYILRFFQKGNPSVSYEVSQIENISKGGLFFSSTTSFKPGDEIAVELKTPFITDTLYLEGSVLESVEKIRGLIYHNRLKFLGLSAQAADVLDKVEQYNTDKGEKQ